MHRIPGLDERITREDERDADGGECEHCGQRTRLIRRTIYCGTMAFRDDYIICDFCGWRDPEPEDEENEVDGEVT
jgi:hypothetical protein